MAEGIARKLVGNKAEIRSAGTEAFPGSPAARVAIDAAKAQGVDLAMHRSQALSKELVDWADIIYVPTLRRQWQACSLFPKARSKIKQLAALDSPISDPIGGDSKTYVELYDRLTAVVTERFIELGLL